MTTKMALLVLLEARGGVKVPGQGRFTDRSVEMVPPLQDPFTLVAGGEVEDLALLILQQSGERLARFVSSISKRVTTFGCYLVLDTTVSTRNVSTLGYWNYPRAALFAAKVSSLIRESDHLLIRF
jgi:hypothetical protein